MNARAIRQRTLRVFRTAGVLLVPAAFVSSLILCCIHCSLGGMLARTEAGGCCAAKSATHEAPPSSPCGDSSSAGCLWKTEFLKGETAAVAPAPAVAFVVGAGEAATPPRPVGLAVSVAAAMPPPPDLRPEFSLGRNSRAHFPPRAC